MIKIEKSDDEHDISDCPNVTWTIDKFTFAQFDAKFCSVPLTVGPISSSPVFSVHTHWAPWPVTCLNAKIESEFSMFFRFPLVSMLYRFKILKFFLLQSI